jgi:ABC-type Na+ efflux pump permease subunit
MPDPFLLHAAMPSEEYARYAAFWTQAIRACVVFLFLLALAVLLCLRLFVVAPLLRQIDAATHALQAHTSLLTGGR